MKEELSIQTVNVEIRVLTLNGKRLTKAVFDQIIESNPAMDCECIGWVANQKIRYLDCVTTFYLYRRTFDNALRKISTRDIAEIIKDLEREKQSIPLNLDDYRESIIQDINNEILFLRNFGSKTQQIFIAI